MPTITPARSTARPEGARWLLVVASVVSVALWYIPGAELVLYPIRLFVTFIHEGGHALMTLMTGGAVVGMAIRPDGSGVTMSEGGARSLVLMAGYIGATSFGALCLQLSRRPGNGRRGLIFLAATVLLITGLWMRPWGEGAFGFFAGAAIGIALAGVARYISEPHAALLTAFLAVQLCLNSLYDLRTLLWLTTHTAADNDAVFMSQAYGLAPWFWAILWAAVSMAILGVSLRSYWRGTRNSDARI